MKHPAWIVALGLIAGCALVSRPSLPQPDPVSVELWVCTGRGTSISGATVSIGHQTAVTDDEGKVYYAQIVPGVRIVSVKAKGHRTVDVAFTVSPGEPLEGTVVLFYD